MSASRHYKRFPNKEQRRMLRKLYHYNHGRHDRWMLEGEAHFVLLDSQKYFIFEPNSFPILRVEFATPLILDSEFDKTLKEAIKANRLLDRYSKLINDINLCYEPCKYKWLGKYPEDEQ